MALYVLLTALLLPLQCIGLLLFAKGFFPYKPVFHGYAPIEPDAPPAVFDSMIFMLVDALRSDFVFSNQSTMEFTQSLILSGTAIPFTARAAPPTVTLPRIKGLTTGSVPNFLDAVLNIAESDDSSSLKNQDSWLAQVKRRQMQTGRLVMFGDDTWLKLFPGMFERSDGTSSFFVSDFTEVDNNVTRHLDAELAATDWDVMILHYLGVDHIGHKGGPDSPFMPQKLKEMDDIIQRLYTHVSNKLETDGTSTLLVLCGDHGMNELGNHGGSSAGETAAALVFASPLLAKLEADNRASAEGFGNDYEYYSVIEQSDVVPTISGLLGNPFPMNNIGLFIPQFLGFWKESEQLNLLKQNAEQMYRILKATFAELSVPVTTTNLDALMKGSDVERIHGLWHTIQSPDFIDSKDSRSTLYSFLETGRNLLARTSSNYDIPSMLIGILIIAWIAVTLYRRAVTSTSSDFVTKAAFSVILLGHGLAMFGSSLVEEEQYFWYWAASAWFIVQFSVAARYKSQRAAVCWLALSAVMFAVRHYHHTGQKFAGSFDIASFLALDFSTSLLWLLIIAEHLLIFKNLQFYVFTETGSIAGFVCSFTPVASLFSFKLSMALEAGEAVPRYLIALVPVSIGAEGLNKRAQAAFLAFGICLIFHIVSSVWNLKKDAFKFIRGVFHIVELLLVLESSTVNIPIFLLYGAAHSILRRYASYSTSTSMSIVLTGLIWQQVSFFASGNSNSLASLDLSNAYNGISGFSTVLVGILLFISNWAGPIYFTLSTVVQLSIFQTRHSSSSSSAYSSIEELVTTDYLSVMHAFHAHSLLAVMLACLILRSHLFIWTVFSPKLLYTAAWFILQQGVVDTFGGLALSIIAEAL
ncbi:transferase [Myxozyma melibiosi]|uniref:GPI ethanolamine phosphate transferase 2 n=1 Tax=Myxozyma melibiosi TaxID=54550 RepID=A0ABR1F5I2_9ASCO